MADLVKMWFCEDCGARDPVHPEQSGLERVMCGCRNRMIPLLISAPPAPLNPDEMDWVLKEEE